VAGEREMWQERGAEANRRRKYGLVLL